VSCEEVKDRTCKEKGLRSVSLIARGGNVARQGVRGTGYEAWRLGLRERCHEGKSVSSWSLWKRVRKGKLELGDTQGKKKNIERDRSIAMRD